MTCVIKATNIQESAANIETVAHDCHYV